MFNIKQIEKTLSLLAKSDFSTAGGIQGFIAKSGMRVAEIATLAELTSTTTLYKVTGSKKPDREYRAGDEVWKKLLQHFTSLRDQEKLPVACEVTNILTSEESNIAAEVIGMYAKSETADVVLSDLEAHFADMKLSSSEYYRKLLGVSMLFDKLQTP